MKLSTKNTKELLMNTVAVAVISYVLYTLYKKYIENFEEEEEVIEIVEPDPMPKKQKHTHKDVTTHEPTPVPEIQAYSGDSDQLVLGQESAAHIQLGSCGGSTQFMSSNLLPKEDPQQEEFAEFAPSLDGKNFVDAYKYVFGSQSQSLRNANRQLRSDPPNPQDAVCPWLQSTIVPEKRRQLDIGTGQ